MSELFDLSGRTALITGSSRGIGLAIAAGLARAGARIVLNGVNHARLERTRSQLAAQFAAMSRKHDPNALKSYETEVKPFLVPFDAFVASNSVAGDLDHSDAIITVK